MRVCVSGSTRMKKNAESYAALFFGPRKRRRVTLGSVSGLETLQWLRLHSLHQLVSRQKVLP